MRNNLADDILERIDKRVASIATLLSTQYNVKPFNSVQEKPEDRLYKYDQMTPQSMEQLIQEKGEPYVNNYIYEMEQLKQRRQQNDRVRTLPNKT